MGGCPYNRTCDQNTGECIDDPCVYIDCPDSLKCYKGQCVRPEDIPIVIYDPNIGYDGGVDTSGGDSSITSDNSTTEQDYQNYYEEDTGQISLEGGFNPEAFDSGSSSGCSCSTIF
jgi:hypothetical protein